MLLLPLFIMLLQCHGFKSPENSLFFSNTLLQLHEQPKNVIYIQQGGIQQLRGQNFAIFGPPLRGQFLYPQRGQKQTFLDPLPPHLVHVVIE